MFHEIEVPDDLVGTVIIADYQLRIFDKDKSKIILKTLSFLIARKHI